MTDGNQPNEFAMRFTCKDISKTKEVKQATERVRIAKIQHTPIYQLPTSDIIFYLEYVKKFDPEQIKRFFDAHPEQAGKLFAFLDAIAEDCKQLKQSERFVTRVGGYNNFYGYYQWNGTASLFYYFTESVNKALGIVWKSSLKWNVYLYIFGYPYDFKQIKEAKKNSEFNTPRGYREVDLIVKNLQKIFH